MYAAVVKVRPHDDFSLTVTFDDGVEGVLDLKPYLNFGVFKKLQNLAQFKQARIAFDTLEWPCGVDLDPEFVRARCKTAEQA